jgi:pimeloyl-ACP methyl ester carboxylesterase
MFNWLISGGTAFAESSYGEGGYCVKEGVIRTHQLTEYIIDKYHVTGKVYLLGISMGSTIALELGAKYPDLYDGVLDICGPKDLKYQYTQKMNYLSLNNQDLSAALIAKGAKDPPYPSSTISAFRDSCLITTIDLAIACRGTPDEKPQAYERISPTYSATGLSIPTITLHGTADGEVDYSTSITFMNAVVAAGHSDMYRLYKVNGGEHADSAVISQLWPGLLRLILWVEYGIPAPPSAP